MKTKTDIIVLSGVIALVWGMTKKPRKTVYKKKIDTLQNPTYNNTNKDKKQLTFLEQVLECMGHVIKKGD